MVIHDLDLAMRYSDHVVVMEKGSYICADTVEAVLASKAIEQAFKVEVCRFPSDERRAYTLFPFE
jgi:iron complex transport system ATP-binding protein